MGIFLKGTAAAGTMDPATLGTLTWPRFLTANLVPVTLGNVDGEIASLTISDPPTQAEVRALRDTCESWRMMCGRFRRWCMR